jgi:hypothetical protein
MSTTLQTLAALFVAVGYVGKLVVDGICGAIDWRGARRLKRIELTSLLRASRADFKTQSELAHRFDLPIARSRSRWL